MLTHIFPVTHSIPTQCVKSVDVMKTVISSQTLAKTIELYSKLDCLLYTISRSQNGGAESGQGHTNTLQNYYFTIKIQHHHKIDDFEATCSTAHAILKVEAALEYTAFNIVHHDDRELVTRCGWLPVCRCGREGRPVWSFGRYSLGLPGRGGFPSSPRGRDGWCSCLAPSRLGQTGRTSRRQTSTNNVCCD